MAKILTSDQVREEFKKRQAALGISQNAFARNLGVNPGQYSGMLKGRLNITEEAAAAIGFRRVYAFIPMEKEDAGTVADH